MTQSFQSREISDMSVSGYWWVCFLKAVRCVSLDSLSDFQLCTCVLQLLIIPALGLESGTVGLGYASVFHPCFNMFDSHC